MKEELKRIENDQGKVYMQAFDLIHQALHVCVARDLMKKYRYERMKSEESLNNFITISHVALENYTVQQMWKLFDKKNSVFNVWHIAEVIPHPDFKEWFLKEIKQIDTELKSLRAWRNNLVSHRSEHGHIAAKKFEDKFPNRYEHEDVLRDFLLNFLSQLKFEMQRIPAEQTKLKLLKDLESYTEFLTKAQKEVLIAY